MSWFIAVRRVSPWLRDLKLGKLMLPPSWIAPSCSPPFTNRHTPTPMADLLTKPRHLCGSTLELRMQILPELLPYSDVQHHEITRSLWTKIGGRVGASIILCTRWISPIPSTMQPLLIVQVKQLEQIKMSETIFSLFILGVDRHPFPSIKCT
jgi:hypothetical protein